MNWTRTAFCLGEVLSIEYGSRYKVGVLEFLGHEEAGNLRAGAVLPDKVYLLQFPYWRCGKGAFWALRGSGVPGDSPPSGAVEGGRGGMARCAERRCCEYSLFWRRDAKFVGGGAVARDPRFDSGNVHDRIRRSNAGGGSGND